MALTLTSSYIANADHVPAGNPIIFTFQTDDGDCVAMELTIKTGSTEIQTLKKQPDIGTTDEFTFDLSQIIQDQLSYTIPDSSITRQEETNGYGSFTFDGKELIENSSTGLIEDGDSLTSGNIRTFFAHNSIQQHPSLQSTREDDLANYIADTAPSTTKFLTHSPTAVTPAYRYLKSETNEEVFLTFIGDMDQITRFYVQALDSSGSIINTYILTFVLSGYKRVIANAGYTYIGSVHAQFLADMTTGGGVAYRCWLGNSAAQQMSEFFMIDIIDRCSRKATRLQWLNDLGGWDAWTFYGNPVYKQSARGDNYDKLRSAPQSTLNTYDGGTTVLSKRATERVQTIAHTITQEEVSFFQQLLRSPRVLLEDSGTFRAVTLNTQNLDVEDHRRNTYKIMFDIEQSNTYYGLRN